MTKWYFLLALLALFSILVVVTLVKRAHQADIYFGNQHIDEQI